MRTPESHFIAPLSERPPRVFSPGLVDIAEKVFADEESLNTLRVGRILSRVQGVLSVNNESATSSTKRNEDGTAEIHIGLQPFSSERVSAFGWGVEGEKEQLLIKLAHESAHTLQNQVGYEQALVDFLNGSNEIEERFHPYIELYTLLNTLGISNGLANDDVYHSQNSSAGRLSVTTLEDMTEFIGAYLISDEYFNFRLDGANTQLSASDKTKIAHLVIQIVGE